MTRGSIACGLAVAVALVSASAAAMADDAATLDADSQVLKRQVLELDRDLRVLEEQALYPLPTQLDVFLAMDIGTFFKLESVRLDVDGNEVVRHTYTDAERAALIKGGTQQLYIGNAGNGPHELVAVFTGQGPHDRAYRRAVRFRFDQNLDLYGRFNLPKLVELRVGDDRDRQQPEFSARTW